MILACRQATRSSCGTSPRTTCSSHTAAPRTTADWRYSAAVHWHCCALAALRTPASTCSTTRSSRYLLQRTILLSTDQFCIEIMYRFECRSSLPFAGAGAVRWSTGRGLRISVADCDSQMVRALRLSKVGGYGSCRIFSFSRRVVCRKCVCIECGGGAQGQGRV